ncbi:hypothetical protein [Petrachloros mirabilis]
MIGQGVLLLLLVFGTVLSGCAAEGDDVDRLPVTAVMASVSEVIGPSGGTLSLPRLASLSFPPDTFPSSTMVDLSVVQIEDIERLALRLDRPVAPMPGLHHIRVTTAGALNSELLLMIRLPNPQNGEVAALMLAHKNGVGEEAPYTIRTSPAVACDNGQAVCVDLTPDWFWTLRSTGQQVAYVAVGTVGELEALPMEQDL